MYKKSIFWFRQDLRTFDNIGLSECIRNSENILPIFILDKNITEVFGGLQDKKFGFIREVLQDLDKQIQKLGGEGLKVFYDYPENIIPYLCRKYEINALYTNKSYSRYGTKRDQNVKELIQKNNIDFYSYKDFLLVDPDEIPARKVYTPYYNIWKTKIHDISLISCPNISSFPIDEHSDISDFISFPKHPYFTLNFGRQRLGENIQEKYNDFRNDLDKDGTSKLSPYIRFGVFSIREIYKKAIGVNEQFIKELAWRDFWQHINYYFPETKTREFQENKRHIKWDHNEFLFQRWCEGKTGYPIVDACIQQLLQTNRMHGRGRMIVASFLTKDLHIDWRLGEAFFKKHLLDYDENMNFGNWQWSASVGADPKPLRIFNPILQSKKFDPETKFIKKYIPELYKQEEKYIHNPLEYALDYYTPIVDHTREQKITREIYKGNSKY